MAYIERQTIKAPKTAMTLSEWRKRLGPDGSNDFNDFIIKALLYGNPTIEDRFLWRLPACVIPRATMPLIFKKKMRTLDFVRKHIGSMIRERAGEVLQERRKGV